MKKDDKKPASAPKSTHAEKKPPRTAWKPGESGNPAGRKPGTRNKSTLMAMALLDRDLQEITETVIAAAKGGDLAMAKFIVERMVPPMRERPISIELPAIDTPEGINAAQQAILDAIGTGDLLPGEGSALSAIVEQKRRALETEELDKRITALEIGKGLKQ